ncbi:hypothetical protein AB0N05_27855 [Nocardia sp. NPDC051030]
MCDRLERDQAGARACQFSGGGEQSVVDAVGEGALTEVVRALRSLLDR